MNKKIVILIILSLLFFGILWTTSAFQRDDTYTTESWIGGMEKYGCLGMEVNFTYVIESKGGVTTYTNSFNIVDKTNIRTSDEEFEISPNEEKYFCITYSIPLNVSEENISIQVIFNQKGSDGAKTHGVLYLNIVLTNDTAKNGFPRYGTFDKNEKVVWCTTWGSYVDYVSLSVVMIFFIFTEIICYLFVHRNNPIVPADCHGKPERSEKRQTGKDDNKKGKT